MKMLIEELPDDQYDDKKQKTADKINDVVIRRYITYNEKIIRIP